MLYKNTLQTQSQSDPNFSVLLVLLVLLAIASPAFGRAVYPIIRPDHSNSPCGLDLADQQDNTNRKDSMQNE